MTIQNIINSYTLGWFRKDSNIIIIKTHIYSQVEVISQDYKILLFNQDNKLINLLDDDL